jgi:hypothetical protein
VYSDGIDVTNGNSVKFTIDDGTTIHEIDLDDSKDVWVRVVKLDQTENDTAVTRLWAVYNRAEDDLRGNSYNFDTEVHIRVDVNDITGLPMAQQSYAFKVETQTEHENAETNSPVMVALSDDDPTLEDPGYDSGFEVTSGALVGAKIVYNSNEVLQPVFGPVDELPDFDIADMNSVGVPMNLQPPTVFMTPVKIFIPCQGQSNVSSLMLFTDDGTDWVLACDAEGNVQTNGEGWMVPGSRVDHPDTNPPTVEIKVYHFTGVQAALPTSQVTPAGGGGGGCFITTSTWSASMAR